MTKFQVSLFFTFTGIISTNNVLISSDFKIFFYAINDKLLEIVDDIFITLRIDSNFTKTEHAADSLLLKSFIQNISYRNYKKYEEIHNLSKITIDCNKTAYFIFIINEMIEEFLMLEGQKPKAHVSVKYYKNKLVNNKATRNYINDLFTENNVTHNLNKLKKEFNVKVEKSMVRDIVYKLLFANPKKSLKRPGPDLKLSWEFNMTSFRTRRVFGGRSAAVTEFPFLASVHVERRFCCAGAIVRKEFVITAASCLRQFHTAQRIPHLPLEVRVGSDYTSQGGELIPVAEMNFHPHFNHQSLSNNLVILKLKKRLKFSEKVRKIMFDTNAYKIPENAENILILGWGSINMKKEHPLESTPFSYAFVDVYNLQECKNVYSSFYVKDKNFCTGYVSKGSGACKNDIGGPAVLGSKLAGVISYGSPRCGQPDAPTVYTKLGYYAGWIHSVLDRIPEGTNHNARIITIPSNMTDAESFENESYITNEVESLAELIGELQVVKHINNTLAEILREKTQDTTNPTTEGNQTSKEEEDSDAINVVNVLKLLTRGSETTTPESLAMPVDVSEYETAQESSVINSEESEETTTHLNIYENLDKQFISGQSPSTYTNVATNAKGAEFTILEEWPRTRIDKELLQEMYISNDTFSYGDNDTNSEDIDKLIGTTANYEELRASNVPIASRAEKGKFLEIVFLKNTPPTRYSIKERTSNGKMEMTLPRDLPLIYYESSRVSSRRKT